MKTHIETSRWNYLLNISISGAIALCIGFWMSFKFVVEKFDWFFIVPAILIFHHFFRAGEYILTGKVISISSRLIEGHEEKGKRAKWTFIYYLTTATLMSLVMLYFAYIHNWS